MLFYLHTYGIFFLCLLSAISHRCFQTSPRSSSGHCSGRRKVGVLSQELQAESSHCGTDSPSTLKLSCRYCKLVIILRSIFLFSSFPSFRAAPLSLFLPSLSPAVPLLLLLLFPHPSSRLSLSVIPSCPVHAGT